MKPIPFMSIYRGWPPRDRGGYVYLVRCNGNPPRYKVGRTLNPSERFATIRNQNAYACDALAIGYARKPDSKETKLHTILKQEGKHVRGEWYELDDEEVLALMDLIEPDWRTRTL